jgi:hypothetical protein
MSFTLQHIFNFVGERDLLLASFGKNTIPDSGQFDKLRHQLFELISDEHDVDMAKIMSDLPPDTIISDSVHAHFLQFIAWLSST